MNGGFVGDGNLGARCFSSVMPAFLHDISLVWLSPKGKEEVVDPERRCETSPRCARKTGGGE